MFLKKKNYIAFLKRKLKYDLMRYKFLKCNRLCTVEDLGMYLYKKNRLFRKKSKKLKLKHKKVNLITKKLTPKKLAKNQKYFNKVYTKVHKKHKQLYNLNEKWSLLEKNEQLTQEEKFKFIGRYRHYIAAKEYTEKKFLRPYKFWKYEQRVTFWDQRKPLLLKFANFLNYFNNEFCLINYKKEYVYNRTDYAIIQINLTPNNISIVVTRANGDVWFWGTSGSKQFKGSRKHTLYAIKAVARSMYYRILSRKIKNLKIVYRGRPNKIRLHEVLGIFQMGAKWDKYDILSIIDMTPLPYNGCRKSKKRR